jgi:PleD family two-component response regulator
MDLTSIRKFLNPIEPQPKDFIRFLHLLLQGIATHAVESDPSELRRFRLDISNISNKLTETLGLDEMSLVIEGAVDLLKEYNRRAGKLEVASKSELRAILTIMTDTIAFLISSSETEVASLQSIEKSIEKASAIDDIRRLRVELTNCLTSVRKESVRLRELSQSQIKSLQAGVRLTVENLNGAQSEPTDTATGLQGRITAELWITNKIAEGRDFAIAVFVVDRLGLINGRFGRAIGDQILLSVAQHLGQEATGECLLLRWSGPAFVLVSPIGPNFSAVERLVKKLGSMRLQKDIETEDGSVMLSITCSWTLEKVTPKESAELICRKLDGFVAARSG